MWRHISTQQEDQGSLPLYFSVLFYAAVEYAARIGVRQIEYSISSKASRGCVTLRQYGYLKLLHAYA